MKILEEKILTHGKVLPGHVLKVDSFLNHQIDVKLLKAMADELYKEYEGAGVNKILTVEASGIAIATMVADRFDCPLLFAKKHKTSNVAGDVYSVPVHSYTHNRDYNIIVSKSYLNESDVVLIVDDFLANGCALRGLINLVEQAGAKVAGCGIAIEKGFQDGGAALRKDGYKVSSLAIVESMSDDALTFRK
ncbi:MAG: xanthine phosphoribosyltransferase [Clostridia bacterium]|nr:xanthine phosphoribosyltransferase [Clostridia bacterium]